MMKLFYEKIANGLSLDNFEGWKVPHINLFSNMIKSLRNYQVEAIENAIKLLAFYYTNSAENSLLYDECLKLGMENGAFDIFQYDKNDKKNELYGILSKFCIVKEKDGRKYIDGYNIFNRASFWMATGSGKTIVIIKLIEVVNYLQKNKNLPLNDIMVLFPDAKIESQFKREVKKYNYGKTNQIEIYSLKDYDEIKNSSSIAAGGKIKVFSYRSDLLRENETERCINVNSYDNKGNWFIFLDEAHKGDKSDGASKRQNYITQWTRNGFLFNFSATFTDPIDYATTIINYNLQKYIDDGYGKKIYVSKSSFQFKKTSNELINELSERDKQKQVLKSFLNFVLIKKQKEDFYYHNPLIAILVNTVGTKDSDLFLVFDEIEKIALGKIDNGLLDEAKKELSGELTKGTKFTIGDGSLEKSYSSSINSISIRDIWKYVYNSESSGSIAIKRGEMGKEIALQLTTSSEPFLLIKVGDVDRVIKEKFKSAYEISKNYFGYAYFHTLNQKDCHINILLGSRAFYEGWDSNRPNIMDFINIGGDSAKKFVLQSIGRGVRIQPIECDYNNRKRLEYNNSHKKELFETLFVYATNKDAVKCILDITDEQKTEREITLSGIHRNTIPFDLILPEYKETNDKYRCGKFEVSRSSYVRMRNMFCSLSKQLFILLFSNNGTFITPKEYDYVKSMICNESNFSFISNRNFKDIKNLLDSYLEYVLRKNIRVEKIRILNEEDIVHYKHIKTMLDEKEACVLQNSLNACINSSSPKEMILKAKNELKSGKIDIDEYTQKIYDIKIKECSNYKSQVFFHKIAEHYYSPIITTLNDKIDYLKHVINVESEIEFVNNLEKYIDKREIQAEWAFSKIDQTTDNIFIWYFDKEKCSYAKFYPDFIFWIKNGKEYRVVFVDPKGLQHASYTYKIDGFRELFGGNESPYCFCFRKGEESVSVRFELYLINNGSNIIGGYEKYIKNNEDFEWLK